MFLRTADASDQNDPWNKLRAFVNAFNDERIKLIVSSKYLVVDGII